MKSKEEILGRAIAILCVAIRCVWEDRDDPDYDTSEASVNSWLEMKNWFFEKGYDAFLTEDEKEFVNTPAFQVDYGRVAVKSYLEEGAPLLLWCVGLLDEPPRYYGGFDRGPSLGQINFMNKNHDFKDLLAKCKMRSQEEIEDQCKTAFLWHWRAVEARLNKGWRGDLRKAIANSLGERYLKYLCAPAFWVSEGRKNTDIVYNGRVIYELSGRSRYRFEMSAQARHKALEWVLGDEDWDDTPTDT